MSPLVAYVALTVLAALGALLHLGLIVQCLKRAHSAGRKALAVLVPIATPVIAWQAGRRVLPIVWAVVLVTYGIVHLAA